MIGGSGDMIGGYALWVRIVQIDELGGKGHSLIRPPPQQRSAPLRSIPLHFALLHSALLRAAPLAGSFVSEKVAMY